MTALALTGSWRSYRAVLSARFRVLLQYRMAALAGVGTQLFWGFIRISIFAAFYRSTTASQPMAFADTVTYVWLGQAMLGLLPFNADPDVRTLVRSGNVAYELMRPMSLYGLWYSRAIANRAAPTLLRSVPLLIVAGLFLGLRAPASWQSGVAWVVSTVASVFLAASIANLLSISLLWTIAGDGAATLLSAAAWLLCGITIPLPFFPEWFQPVVNFLPFRGVMDTPFRLYMGHIPSSHAPAVILHQLGWTLALVLLGRAFLARGVRRTVIQGG